VTRVEAMKFGHACEALRLAMETACIPPRSDMPLHNYIQYYGEPVSRCLWYVRYICRQARRLGLYPETAVLEAEANRRRAA
jgi:hypothetical protein